MPSVVSLVMKFSLLVLGVLTSVHLHAAVIDNFTQATNDRFTNDASFIGAGYDWSGVGRTADGNWVTLLGDNYFIAANHFRPAVGEQVLFEGHPTGYTVTGGQRIGSTDLWIGYTTQTIDLSLKRYSITTSAATDLASTGLVGSTLFTSGNGTSTGGPFNHVVGQNQAESWISEGTNTFATPEMILAFVDGMGNPSNVGWDQIIMFQNSLGDNVNNYQTHESQLVNGDSGSPLFSTSGGDLILEGIAYAVSIDLPGNFIDTAGDFDNPLITTDDANPDKSELRNASYYTYTGAYTTEIDAYIATIPAGVPEPSICVLTSLSALALLRRKRS